MKIAIVHDILMEFGGAERVLLSLLKAFPQAHIYTSFFSPERMGEAGELLKKQGVTASWADKIAFIKKFHSPLRFLYPYIWESFTFKDYDVVISSSGAIMSKGILVRPGTLHISYIHHQPKFLYGYETSYDINKNIFVKTYAALINHPLRLWDYIATQRPHYILTNSYEVQKRIKKFYNRDATVLYPPVTIPKQVKKEKGEYFLTLSRLQRPKHTEVLVKTATEYSLPLMVVGEGQQLHELKRIAGPTVTFKGKVTDTKREALYQKAIAFLNAAVEEDFGIANVEAMGHGVPVIAYKSGGHIETIEHGKTGFLVEENTPLAFKKALDALQGLSVKEQEKLCKAARLKAEQFSEEMFIRAIKTFVEHAYRHYGT